METEIVVAGHLQPGEIKLIESLGEFMDPKVLVDVGSCFDEYTNHLRHWHPEAKIYSFDPQSGTPAVGAVNGELEMMLFPGCPARSTGAPKYKEVLKGEHILRTVPLARLDALITEPIDFLKIDTEGMEMDVLEGLGWQWPKLIQFEYGFTSFLQGHSLDKFGEFFYLRGFGLAMIDWHINYGNMIAGPPELLKKVQKCIIQKL